MKIILYIVLFASGLGVGWLHERAAVAEIKADLEKERAKHAKAETSAIGAARTEEQRIEKGLNTAAADHLKGKDDAKTQESHLIADLRADIVRLRKHWGGCETSRLSQAAGSAAELDAAARIRDASAARIVRIAAECDAHVSALQQALNAERRASGRN